MKKISILMIAMFLVFAVSISAQQKNSKVPENVSKAFQTAHPDAKDISWDKEGINYEANYKVNGSNYSVVITDLGKILETETELKTSDLPQGVIKYINDNYSGYTLSGAAKIVDDKGNTKYEAEISKGSESKDVMFDQNGNPIHHKKESKENEEEEDEDQD